MKFLSLLFAFIVISFVSFSQTTSKEKVITEPKMKVRKAANYYLKKKISPSPGFSVEYTSLFVGLRGYTKKDTLRATKLINRLYKVNDVLFYRLMRIRLEWEFKQHLVKFSLDSVLLLLKNNIDSSKYYYMLGLYFRDSMNANWARRLGFVKVNYEDNEIVDWRKMKIFKWRNPKEVWSLGGDSENNFKVDPMGDSSIFYYKMAIDNDAKEFHYLKEFLLFMFNFQENKDVEMLQVINSKLENYSDEEKKWLKEYLDSLY